MSQPLLEIVDVRKRYGRTVALHGVGFQVAAGELFGLLGPNGAGKTTLLSILAGLSAATAGDVRLDGQPLTPGRPDLRRRIGIAPQELALYDGLTAAENLRFFGELYDLRGPALRQRVGEVLEAVALTDRADQRVGTYSGGMKRRLNLGVAILHRPDLLLLDEPTAGVDPQSRHHIFEGVRRLNAGGTTVIYTSHYMEEVQALCRRVGILDHGRLIACDELPALLKMLDGTVRFRLTEHTAEVLERVRKWPGVRAEPIDGQLVEVRAPDVTETLVRLGALFAEVGATPTGLETQGPNLERVFLHLTGSALRD